jgi:hypothetical protein
MQNVPTFFSHVEIVLDKVLRNNTVQFQTVSSAITHFVDMNWF